MVSKVTLYLLKLGHLTACLLLTDFTRLRTAMGGQNSTDEFVRLFMVPGYTHIGGYAAYRVDNFYDYIVDWVEHGKAPEYLIGGKYSGPYETTKDDVLFKRKHFPYPYTEGLIPGADPNLAESWERKGPIEETFYSYDNL